MTLHQKTGVPATKQYHCVIRKKGRYLHCKMSITYLPAFAYSKEIIEKLEE